MWQFIKQKINVVFRGIHNEKIKTGFLQSIPFWTASLITGLIAVLYAKFFSLAEIGSAYIFRHHSWSLFILTPACFLLAWWIILRFAPYARGSGIPQVMAAIELATPKYGNKVDKLLSVRIIAVKIISSLVMVFGGGVVGREGPTIQI